MLKCAENCAISPPVTCTSNNHTIQLRGHALEFADSLPNIDQVRPGQAIDLYAGKIGLISESQQAADLLQAEPEVSAARDETQPLHLVFGIGAITTTRAQGSRHQAYSFVVSNGLQMAAAGGRRFPYLHVAAPLTL